MNYQNDDLCIKEINELLFFVVFLEKFFVIENVVNIVVYVCKVIYQIFKGDDDCLLVVIGFCFIYDLVVVKEYVVCLLILCEVLKGEFEIVMWVYFEKLCIIVGWKGFINDFYMDNSFCINDGLCIVCKLLLDINDSGLLVVGEFFDMIILQYVVDLMSWGVIGV